MKEDDVGKHHHQIMIYMLDGLKNIRALFECSKDPIQNFKKIYTIRHQIFMALMPILILKILW